MLSIETLIKKKFTKALTASTELELTALKDLVGCIPDNAIAK